MNVKYKLNKNLKENIRTEFREDRISRVIWQLIKKQLIFLLMVFYLHIFIKIKEYTFLFMFGSVTPMLKYPSQIQKSPYGT